MRVLVVEDDKDMGVCITSLLDRNGHESLLVTRLADICDGAMRLVPDVVLLDLKLPDSDGVETLEYAREYLNDRISIVVYSGYSMWQSECLRLGADDFISKGDITTESLLDVINLAINQHRLLLAVDKKADSSLGGLLKIDASKVGDRLISMAGELRLLATG